MLTLALDTTAECGSVALVDRNHVIEEVLLEAPRGFSMVLFGAIEALLARHHLTLRDIELFAGASGPGSFTGVRVGLAAIKGLAEVMDRPATAVSNLAAIAETGSAPLRAVAIDAHRGEVFAALYDDAGNIVVPEMVTPLETFTARIAGYPDVQYVAAPRALAAWIARIAIRQAEAGGTVDPAAIEANYVRRSDAELLWQAPAGWKET
jgi:tRNA threonylcarbamoyladenosine biosynthesis protein TsaB